MLRPRPALRQMERDPSGGASEPSGHPQEAPPDRPRRDDPLAYLPKPVVSRIPLTTFADDQIFEKDSGYTSVHYVVRHTATTTRDSPWFELQVRTLAQHVWAEIEHLLGYKPEGHVPTTSVGS